MGLREVTCLCGGTSRAGQREAGHGGITAGGRRAIPVVGLEEGSVDPELEERPLLEVCSHFVSLEVQF